MSHHSNPINPCPLCEEKLLDAHPVLQIWFRTFVKPGWSSCHISWSFRDQTSQEQAFKEHKTRLHWPNSPHNQIPSLALDLFFLDDEGKLEYPMKELVAISEGSRQQKYPIAWGGVFHTLGDFDHYQVALPKPL